MARNEILVFSIMYGLLASISIFHSCQSPASQVSAAGQSRSYIIHGDSLSVLAEAVDSVGGNITRELGDINAVAATLSAPQYHELRKHTAVLTITRDSAPRQAGGPFPVAEDIALIGADRL